MPVHRVVEKGATFIGGGALQNAVEVGIAAPDSRKYKYISISISVDYIQV